jgi:hypothetical protein
MKRRWRQVLAEWKDECMRTNTNYATLPKQAWVYLYFNLPISSYPILF